MRSIRNSLLIILGITTPTLAETHVRVATYNIKFFSDRSFNCGNIPVSDVRTQGDRLDKLRQVIEDLAADIIGLQEINDRDALELLFPAEQWWMIIDDDSGGCQDLAFAVRKPLSVAGFTANDQDADDDHFLFEGSASNSFFPRRRDLLAINVAIPGRADPLMIMVHHAKSRSGGRNSTEHRRVGAARAIVQMIEHDLHEQDVIILGDFNDNPDDQSLNVLESGNPHAPGGAEETSGPFLHNLCEPLCVAGHVTHGRKSNDIVGERVDTIDAQSRGRNNNLRGTDDHTGDILFDQILIRPQLLSSYVAGSAQVYDRAIAVRGNNTTRASDHLPVFADFVFASDDDGEPSTIRITALLPNPVGQDAGNEQVTLTNDSDSPIALTGWKLMDQADNTFSLSGTVSANGSLRITMKTFSMPLNQSGDSVRLINGQQVIHQVSYKASQVAEGQDIDFD